ncbi:MAG TPA: hypothetical protein DCQ58_08420 [Saprospirales bacterium]|nr:hypothetical protein [Saprospirales bacterium]
MEHEVVGQPKSQGEALFWIKDTDKLVFVSIADPDRLCFVSIADPDRLCFVSIADPDKLASSVSQMLTSLLRQYRRC